MRIALSSFAVVLLGCSESVVETADEATMSKPNSEEQIALNKATPNLEAEARLAPILDALTKKAFNLSSDCTESTKINSENKRVFVGATTCDLDGVNVYLGSAEIEYKVKNCTTNGNLTNLSYFVFGSKKMGSFYIVSDNEVHEPIFVCS